MPFIMPVFHQRKHLINPRQHGDDGFLHYSVLSSSSPCIRKKYGLSTSFKKVDVSETYQFILAQVGRTKTNFSLCNKGNCLPLL